MDLHRQEHVAARATVDDLLEGVKSVSKDSDASLKVLSCDVSLLQLNCLSELCSLLTMEKVG